MFFAVMSPEEKLHCVSLFSCLAKADGHFHEKERELIAGYSRMMGLDASNISQHSLESLVQYFAHKSEVIKKAVFVESMGLVLSDEVLHHLEETTMQQMREAFGLTTRFQEQCYAWVQEMLPVFYKGFALVGIKSN